MTRDTDFSTPSSSELLAREHFALTHGIVMAGEREGEVRPAPYSLHPFQYSEEAFHTGERMAPLFNQLVDSVANDSEWLLKTLETTCKYDDFTGRLMDIYKKAVVDNGGPSQRCVLGLHRSDYMQHEVEGDDRVLLQVELNTIASSFGSLSSKISQMHRVLSCNNDDSKVPRNEPHIEFVAGMASAHHIYLKQRNLANTNNNVIVVMVVQPGERNFSDQRILEFTLLERHGIRMERYSLKEIIELGKIRDDGALVIADKEVSLFYFRAGYSPNDYPSNAEWDARLVIEKSKAIKCPNIAYHLVGTKKVQQVLAVPGQLERFLPADDAAALRRVFADLYSLDPDETSEETLQEVIETANKSCEKFVMKPQREGGGNNIYNEDIIEAFKTMSRDQLKSYILMERICPPPQKSVIVARGEVLETSCICEFGVFGVYLNEHIEELKPAINSYAGHILRVKAVGVNEGGVATGYSCLSSPRLC